MSPRNLLLTSAFLLALSPVLFAQAPASSAAVPASEPTVADAQSKLDGGKIDDAIAELLKVKAQDPNAPGLARVLGLASFRRGDFATTATELKPVTEQNPDDREAVQLLGLSYYYLGQTKDAIPLLERVHGWFPTANVDASYVLGISYLRTQDFDKARKAFAEMYGVAPDSGASHLILARMLIRENYEPVAEKELLKAEELDPKLPGVHLFLGELYTFRLQIDKAISELNTELAIDPVNAEALYKLADVYQRDQKWDEAQKYLQRSIWLDSTSTGPYILMAKVLLKKNEYLLASRAAQKAISMDANNYYPHFLLGQALLKLGKTEQGSAELKLSQQLQINEAKPPAELQSKQ